MFLFILLGGGKNSVDRFTAIGTKNYVKFEVQNFNIVNFSVINKSEIKLWTD